MASPSDSILLYEGQIVIQGYDTVVISAIKNALAGQVLQIYPSCISCYVNDIILYRPNTEDIHYTKNNTVYSVIKDTQIILRYTP